jgi:non-ribosomal peptide synthetase component F
VPYPDAVRAFMRCVLWVCRELCIASVGVARNYLHPGERDGERFVQWSSKWAAIMGSQAEGLCVYRTGDEARRDSRGWLELCGRRDQHVKVGRVPVLTSMRSAWRRRLFGQESESTVGYTIRFMVSA